MSRNSGVSLALGTQLLHDLGYLDLADVYVNVWRMCFDKHRMERLDELSSVIPRESVATTSRIGNEGEAIEKVN